MGNNQLMKKKQLMRHWAVLVSIVVTFAFFLSYSTTYGLESYPENLYDRDNPPPSGYWYSDVPGSYNPWTDVTDTPKTLLNFPATNEGVTAKEDIQMLPEGWLPGDRWSKDTYPASSWEFVDLGTLNHKLTGNNWVHGNEHQYLANTWVQQFSGEGTFSYVRSNEDQYRFNDLAGYRGIAIEVSNLGDTYVVFYSKMNTWWGTKYHGARIGLEPGETDIIYHPFKRDQSLMAPEVAEYFGVTDSRSGYPGGHLNDSDPTNFADGAGIWIISAMVPPGVQQGDVKWTLNKMWAGGEYDPPTVDEINDPNYEPWTDEYGQWRHDDWVGKIWNQQDIIDQYAKLEQYIEEKPGPSEWDKWGGWEAGPQLEATGYFRVEKYNDRWWFVDPDGKLFLSQGAMAIWPTGQSLSGEAGYTVEEYFDEIYFPRLRSIGINTAGGRSREKRLLGIMPYVNQMYTNYGSITEEDILSEGDTAFRQHIKEVIFKGEKYARDPYCLGFLIDNELKLYGGDTLSKDQVEKIYFGAIREALDQLAAKIGRPPIPMFDPASNGGYWMAYYSDVLTMHRMAGYTPGTHLDKFDALGTWGIDRPVGQFSFNMGNLDQGLASYGVTMYLNQRNRAQGVNSFMRQAYAHPNNIAVHEYAYKTPPGKPLWGSHHIVGLTDALDYWYADYVGGIGDDIYYIHMGLDVPCKIGHCEDNKGFQLYVSPPSLAINPGGAATYDVLVDAVSNFTRTVTLAATVPSPDLEYNLAPLTGTPPFTATLTLTDTRTGTLDPGLWYTVPIIATDSAYQKETTKTVALLVGGSRVHLPMVFR